jgi:5-methylcytosine-specific restriction protein A
VTHPLIERPTPPAVDALRITERGRDIGVLEIVCPFCDRLHYHGGSGAPGAGDGHRTAHCTHPASGPGYVLREVGKREGRSPLRHGSAYHEPTLLELLPSAGEARRSRRAPISVGTRTRILERDDFRCRRCGTGPREERLVVDHVVPVARGGTSDDANLQTLCEPCNQGKADRAPHPHDLEGLV